MNRLWTEGIRFVILEQSLKHYVGLHMQCLMASAEVFNSPQILRKELLHGAPEALKTFYFAHYTR